MPSPDEERPLFKLGPVLNEYPIYDELHWDMQHLTPQAILRDLHRPVKRFTVSEFEVHELPRDGGRNHFKAARAGYFVNLRIPIQELVPTNRWIQEEMRELRRIKALPWQDAPKIESTKERMYGAEW
jgi:hypothetical protein